MIRVRVTVSVRVRVLRPKSPRVRVRVLTEAQLGLGLTLGLGLGLGRLDFRRKLRKVSLSGFPPELGIELAASLTLTLTVGKDLQRCC